MTALTLPPLLTSPSDPYFSLKYPQVASEIYRLSHSLCADRRISSVVLSFLHSREIDFFQRQLEWIAAPFDAPSAPVPPSPL